MSSSARVEDNRSHRDSSALSTAQPTCVSDLSDDELLSGAAVGHLDCLQALIDRHQSWMHRTARHIVRDRGESEDVVQEVWVELRKAAGGFDRQKGKVRAWLFGITRNQALKRRRYLDARGFYESLRLDEAGNANDSGGIAPWLGLAQQEEPYLVQELLSRLKPAQRITIQLKMFEGLAAAQVAEELGKSVETVENNFSRGLKKLAKLVRKAGI
jgi:RNA polymerase sigma-70 factor (ECF subfamily)